MSIVRPTLIVTGKLLVFIVAMAMAVGALVTTTSFVAPRVSEIYSANENSAEPIDLAELSVRSLVYDRRGGVLATFHAEENRSTVKLEEVPDEVVTAILSVEDEKFYRHSGVDVRATGRALLRNVEAGGIEQGGSTITQQLIKNLVLSSEQDLDRKSREAILALRLEDQLSKDEILEWYVNTVYFGSGAYGVQAAAETYWGVDVQDLDWGKAALLASLIRNPNGYDPTRSPEVALEKRD